MTSIVLEDRKGGQIWALGRLKKCRSTPTHPPVLQKRAQKVLKTKESAPQKSEKERQRGQKSLMTNEIFDGTRIK
jgi:hypothetical protein